MTVDYNAAAQPNATATLAVSDLAEAIDNFIAALPRTTANARAGMA